MNKRLLAASIAAGLFCLLFSASCTTPPPPGNKVAFSPETFRVTGVNLPEHCTGYNYSWYGFDSDSLLKLQYVIDDSLLQVFSPDGVSNKLYTLPHDAPAYSVSLPVAAGRLLYFRHPSKLYEYRDSSFVLLFDVLKQSGIERDGLAVGENAGLGNYVHIYRDSFLLVPVTPGKKGRRYSNLHEPYPCFARINLHSGATEYLDYLMPEHYLRYDHYTNHTVSALLVKDQLIISYPYRETVEVYSLRTNKIVARHELKSYHQDGEIEFLSPGEQPDRKRKARYMVEAAHYGYLVYNPYTRQYYRIFYHGLPEKNAAGDYTIATDRRISVAVYDNQFRFLGDYMFPKKISFLIGITPVPEGLIINSSSRKAKGGMKLTRINITYL